MTLIKNIGEVTALVAEASTANEPSELLDGKSGDTAFPYAKFKALATVGEVDPVTKQPLTGYPDGNAAWLEDDATIRVVYQSESYATNSNETYGWLMESGVKFTGSHIHYIDYDRAKFASFLDNEAPASTMFKASGHLFDKVYNDQEPRIGVFDALRILAQAYRGSFDERMAQGLVKLFR